MWMEETIGERINVNRTREAVATGADQIAVGCPFCRVMLSDGLTAEQTDGNAREEVEVLDVAQMLLASVKGESATRSAAATTAADARSEETRAEPSAEDVTRTEQTVTATEDVGPAAEASGGTSLFDVAPAAETAEPSPETSPEAAPDAGGGSLFDLGEAESSAEVPSADEGRPDDGQVSDGGSLFDIAGTSPESEASTTEPEAAPEVEASTPSPSGSLFDIEPGEAAAGPEPSVEQSPEPDEGQPAASTQTSAERSTAAPAQATELPDDVSLFDIGSSEPPSEPTTEPPSEPTTEPPSETPSESTTEPTSGPRTDVELDETTSLFDL
jgi:hypothetical protein